MKLEDFKKFKNKVLTNWDNDFKGFMQEQFLTNKEYAIQLTDEEMNQLSHALKSHMGDANVLNIVQSEALFAKTGVSHEAHS